jgi:hypothetical protein
MSVSPVSTPPPGSVKIPSAGWRARHQHLAVADNGRADREIRALRIGSLVGHYCSLRMVFSENRFPLFGIMR